MPESLIRGIINFGNYQILVDLLESKLQKRGEYEQKYEDERQRSPPGAFPPPHTY